MNRIPALALAGPLACLALVAGCGGDDSSPATTGEERPSEVATTAEPQDSASAEPQDSSPEPSAPEVGSGGGDAAGAAPESAASKELTKAAKEGLDLFLPVDQEAGDVACAVTDEQKQGKTIQYELTCTYEAGGITRSQNFRGVDTGDGSPSVLPVR